MDRLVCRWILYRGPRLAEVLPVLRVPHCLAQVSLVLGVACFFPGDSPDVCYIQLGVPNSVAQVSLVVSVAYSFARDSLHIFYIHLRSEICAYSKFAAPVLRPVPCDF